MRKLDAIHNLLSQSASLDRRGCIRLASERNLDTMGNHGAGGKKSSIVKG
jgi:hypothetical protein